MRPTSAKRAGDVIVSSNFEPFATGPLALCELVQAILHPRQFRSSVAKLPITFLRSPKRSRESLQEVAGHALPRKGPESAASLARRLRSLAQVIACTPHHPLTLMLILFLKQMLGSTAPTEILEHCSIRLCLSCFPEPTGRGGRRGLDPQSPAVSASGPKDLLSEAQPHRGLRRDRSCDVHEVPRRQSPGCTSSPPAVAIAIRLSIATDHPSAPA